MEKDKIKLNLDWFDFDKNPEILFKKFINFW